MSIRIVQTIENIADCIYRVEELEEMDIRELCEESGVPYSITQKHFRNNLIASIISLEYGHDMLIYYIALSIKLEELQKVIPDYNHPLEDVLLWEKYPLVEPVGVEGTPKYN